MSLYSVTEDLKQSLRSARRAILGRGGEISATAGFKDLPEAIYKIPADASLAFQTDDRVAYEKIVPSGAEEYAQVAKVGGMTYKEIPIQNNLVRGVQFDGWTSIDDSSIARYFSLNEYLNQYSGIDGLAFDGKLCTFSAYGAPETMTIFLKYVVYNKDGSHADPDTPEHDIYSGESFEYRIPEGGWVDCVIFIQGSVDDDTLVTLQFMINEGEEALPYEPVYYELRDAAVSELVSEGAQLLSPDYVDGTKSSNGITFTDNGDGTITLNGTATAQANYILKNEFTLVNGVTYIVSTNHADVDMMFRYVAVDGTLTYPRIITKTDGDNVQRLQLVVKSGVTLNNVIIQPMMNQGTTPAPYKPYRTDAVDTFPISAELRAFLEQYGYGRGVSGYPNYIDFERKMFVQRFKEIDLNTLSFTQYEEANSTIAMFRASISDIRQTTTLEEIPLLLCPIYKTVAQQGTWYDGYITQLVYSNLLFCCESHNTTLDDFLAKINGIKLIYELAEPIEIDISAYLTDDNFIVVEGGGIIRVVNEYEQDAPSTIGYIFKAEGEG